jgi:hypothetical protein
MPPCKHTKWLGLASGGNRLFLQSTDRLSTLLEDHLSLDATQPNLIVMVGNEQKALFLKELLKKFHQPQR